MARRASSNKSPQRRSGAKKNSGASAPGQRQLRVAERIRHILSDVLMQGSFRDPALAKANMISITAVNIGPDLKHATAYIMPLGGKDVETTVEALNRAAGYFRSEVGPKLDLRYTPKITFRADGSFEEAAHIDSILRQDRVRKDVEREETEDEE